MTPEAQRIAIAEACGWTRDYNPDSEFIYRTPSGRGMFSPLGCLNAMHEAEKVLTDEQRQEFLGWLTQFVLPSQDTVEQYYWLAVHATAAQRAEAFLRTIGKWDDAK